ncbi:MAG: hypothetical protein M1812_005130 [Candelaria pacifica]|nr:MAG: hypothetical protein M1812_005130 [Candelaria pacifica]
MSIEPEGRVAHYAGHYEPPIPKEAPEEGLREIPEIYVKLAAFMKTDTCYMNFRRFRDLNLQNLLYLQNEVAILEAQSKSDRSNALYAEVIKEKLESYNRALLAQAQLTILRNPDRKSIRDMWQWLEDHQYINPAQRVKSLADQANDQDLVSLADPSDSKGWIYRLVDRLLWRFFAKAVLSDDPNEGTIFKYEDAKIRLVVRCIVTTLTATLLLVPIIILYFLGPRWQSLVVIVVSTAVFSIVMAIATEGRNHEIMMAAAAVHRQGMNVTAVTHVSKQGLIVFAIVISAEE